MSEPHISLPLGTAPPSPWTAHITERENVSHPLLSTFSNASTQAWKICGFLARSQVYPSVPDRGEMIQGSVEESGPCQQMVGE